MFLQGGQVNKTMPVLNIQRASSIKQKRNELHWIQSQNIAKKKRGLTFVLYNKSNTVSVKEWDIKIFNQTLNHEH